MTSPRKEITVICPDCNKPFTDWYRPSINLGLGEKWTQERIDEETSVCCSHCNKRFAIDSLIVDESGVFRYSPSSDEPIADSPEEDAITRIVSVNGKVVFRKEEEI